MRDALSRAHRVLIGKHLVDERCVLLGNNVTLQLVSSCHFLTDFKRFRDEAKVGNSFVALETCFQADQPTDLILHGTSSVWTGGELNKIRREQSGASKAVEGGHDQSAKVFLILSHQHTVIDQ